jgi:protein-S-isoprenylcysteine O-methyltransferase Ste14
MKTGGRRQKQDVGRKDWGQDMTDRVSMQGLRYILQRAGILVIFGACIFAAAGSWTWGRAWAGLTVCLLSEFTVDGLLAIRAPNTLNQRGTWHHGVKPFDILFATLYLTLCICLAVVIGLDCIRFQWSSLPWATFVVGAGLVAAATVLGTWAMLVNEHFEQLVRIQTERHHRVVTAGPYRLVRHPGYLAGILSAVAGPLLFGSRWASIPAGLLAMLLVWRTFREDLTLRAELEGYAEYTKQTPHRLIPWVW